MVIIILLLKLRRILPCKFAALLPVLLGELVFSQQGVRRLPRLFKALSVLLHYRLSRLILLRTILLISITLVLVDCSIAIIFLRCVLLFRKEDVVC